MTEIRVTGLKELRLALKAVDAAAPKELAKTNHEVGQIVVREAQRRAPSGPHQGGGSIVPIKDSIHANQAGMNVTVIAGGVRSPHAVVTEFGGVIARAGHGGGKAIYRSRIKFRGGNVTHVRAQPYLYPAVRATKALVEEVYLRMLDRLVAVFGK